MLSKDCIDAPMNAAEMVGLEQILKYYLVFDTGFPVTSVKFETILGTISFGERTPILISSESYPSFQKAPGGYVDQALLKLDPFGTTSHITRRYYTCLLPPSA